MLNFSIFNSSNKPISISIWLKKYFRVLEVISSLNCKLGNKSDVSKKNDLELV